MASATIGELLDLFINDTDLWASTEETAYFLIEKLRDDYSISIIE